MIFRSQNTHFWNPEKHCKICKILKCSDIKINDIYFKRVHKTIINTIIQQKYLDNNVTLSCASAIQFPMFLYHNNLSFFFYLLHVFFHLIEDAAVILLGYTYKLEKHILEIY